MKQTVGSELARMAAEKMGGKSPGGLDVLEAKTRALAVLSDREGVNVSMHGRAQALVEPSAARRVHELEEAVAGSPADSGLKAELTRCRDAARDDAGYFLIDEDPVRAELFRGLKSKGWPVQEYWPVGTQGEVGELYVSPRLGERQEKVNPATIPYSQRLGDQASCMELMGRLHGEEQIMHGHPHGGNLLKDSDGGWVILDAKRSEKKQLNWADPENVFQAFQRDYVMLGRNLYQAGIRREDLQGMADAMVKQYPVDDGKGVAGLIHGEFTRQHDFYALTDEFTGQLKADPGLARHREVLQTLITTTGAGNLHFPHAEKTLDAFEAVIQGKTSTQSPRDELSGIYSELGFTDDKLTPPAVEAWQYLKERLGEFRDSHPECASILSDRDRIKSFMPKAVVYATHEPVPREK
ncbi:MAG: hypothetical protein ABH834_03995 [Candidatus Altiarchaeota archaeon]